MRVKIDPDHIHVFEQDVLDPQGNPTGEQKEVLQLDIEFPEYPLLPTYGITLDYPTTAQELKAVIKAKANEVRAQIQKDQAVKDLLGSDILDFNIDLSE